MYDKIVIGIDQSYTRTGISLAADGKLLKVSYIPFASSACKSDKRKYVANILSNIIVKNQSKAKQFIVIVERIRQFSGGTLSMDYIKSTGALIGAIVDTASIYNVPVFSVDTRAWKAAVVGTSKPKANSFNVDPKKWPTIEYLVKHKLVADTELLVAISARCKKFAIEKDGIKYCFNDDAADSACIALYGFTKGRQLNRED